MRVILGLVGMVGCGGEPEAPPGVEGDDPVSSPWVPPTGVGVDRDGDGALEDDDCDDLNPRIFPGADETCDGFDQDCDGEVDEDPTDLLVGYPDGDGDGTGDLAGEVRGCVLPPDLVAVGGDCDDGDPTRFPGAPELCNDIDDDCNPGTTEDHVVSVGGQAFATVQDALNAADDGDVVTACDGTYLEHLTIPPFDALTLTSLHGAESTILDAEGTGKGMVSTGGAFVLTGWTVRNGAPPGDPTYDWGAGLSAGYTDVTVEDCVFSGNSHASGAAIGLYEGSATIRGTTFSDNHATWEGGALAGYGVTFTITDSLFVGNRSDEYAGAISGIDNTLVLERTTFEGNSARHSGAVHAEYARIVDCTFTGNTAVAFGGAVNLYADGAEVTTSLFEGNSARSGGGLVLWGNTRVDRVEVIGNHATTTGGGLVVYHQTDLVGSTIRSNTADEAGGGAALIYSFGGMSSVGTDWGADLTDNLPDDVYDTETGRTFVAEAGVDFECVTGVGCR